MMPDPSTRTRSTFTAISTPGRRTRRFRLSVFPLRCALFQKGLDPLGHVERLEEAALVDRLVFGEPRFDGGDVGAPHRLDGGAEHGPRERADVSEDLLDRAV